ncbi:MAG: serine/threonine protein kinase [Candidatus Riflebacteria bacterium]|nr:serine/threonine protein kinase [Candidatus Riflebacteria bacterium]
MKLSAKFTREYQILGKLGEGGMGHVFLAQQLSLQRQVAIKFMTTDGLLGKEDSVNRFTREARTLAELHHPNILQIYDVGVEDERLYLVLEYVPGESVRDRLERVGKLPVAEAVAIALDVGQGLNYAHHHKIIHRDVKPENVLLSESGVVKLLDFGLAKAMGECTGLTKAGVILGTPAYMAPEQIIGKPPSRSWDIFALGVLLYEMICGQTPFSSFLDSDSLVGRTRLEAPDLPERGVPAPVVRVVRRSLRKDPAERFRTVGEMISQLEGLSGPVGPAPTPAAGLEAPGDATVALGSQARRRQTPEARHIHGSPEDRSADRNVSLRLDTGAAADRLAGSKMGRFLRTIRSVPLIKHVPGGACLWLAVVGMFALGAGTVAFFLTRILVPAGLAETARVAVVPGVKGALVRWTSRRPCVGTARVAGPGAPEKSVSDAAPSRDHELLLTGLKAGASYQVDALEDRKCVWTGAAHLAPVLQLPESVDLSGTGNDEAAFQLTLPVPATLEAKVIGETNYTLVTSKTPVLTHRVTLRGPAAETGMLFAVLKARSVDGFSVETTVSLVGTADLLERYAGSALFQRLVGEVDEAGKNRARPVVERRRRVAQILDAVQPLRGVTGTLRGMGWLIRAPTTPLDRQARLYQALSDLAILQRVLLNSDLAWRPGESESGALASLVSFRDADRLASSFAASRTETIDTSGPYRKLRPWRVSNFSDRGARARVDCDLRDLSRTASKVEIVLVGVCLLRSCYFDVKVNGQYRLRFFSDFRPSRVVDQDEVFTAEEKLNQLRRRRQALSLVVPAGLLKPGVNQFEIVARPMTTGMSAIVAECPLELHDLYFEPVRQ